MKSQRDRWGDKEKGKYSSESVNAVREKELLVSSARPIRFARDEVEPRVDRLGIPNEIPYASSIKHC